MSSFPTSVINFLQLQDGVDKVIAAHPNDRGNEITAIETMLGAMGAAQAYTATYKNLLTNYLRGCRCEFKSTTDLYVRVGELVITDGSTGFRFRQNTSDTTVTFSNLDTGSVASNTTYYIYAAADSSGTNFTVVLSTNSTTPSGYTFYKKIGIATTDGSSHLVAGAVTSLAPYSMLGEWQAVSNNTVYQAKTDGFITVEGIVNINTTTNNTYVYTDGSNPPATCRGYWDTGSGTTTAFCQGMFPVRKGDYYKITVTGTNSAVGTGFPTPMYYWMPINAS